MANYSSEFATIENPRIYSPDDILDQAVLVALVGSQVLTTPLATVDVMSVEREKLGEVVVPYAETRPSDPNLSCQAIRSTGEAVIVAQPGESALVLFQTKICLSTCLLFAKCVNYKQSDDSRIFDC